MDHEILSDFDVPWCQALLNSPDYVFKPGGRTPPPPADQAVPQRLLDVALKTETTIRAWRRLVSKGIRPGYQSREEILLLSLGSDLSGHRDLLCGGVFGVLIDQISAISAFQVGGSAVVTQQMTVRFIKSVPLPALVVCRAAVSKHEGSEIHVKSTISVGENEVCAEGETVFWVRRRKGTRL